MDARRMQRIDWLVPRWGNPSFLVFQSIIYFALRLPVCLRVIFVIIMLSLTKCSLLDCNFPVF